MKALSENYNQPFPKRLRMVMDEYGVNQQELADFVGVKRQTVAQWKDGKTTPDIYNFKRIAEYFKLPYEYMLGDTDSKVREYIQVADNFGLGDEAVGTLVNAKKKVYEGRENKESFYPLTKILSHVLGHPDFTLMLQFLQDAAMEHKKSRTVDKENLTEAQVQQVKKAAELLAGTGKTIVNSYAMTTFYLDQVQRLMRMIALDLPVFDMDEFQKEIPQWGDEEDNWDSDTEDEEWQEDDLQTEYDWQTGEEDM